MANDYKKNLLTSIEKRCGSLNRLPGSQSLIELQSGVRVYLRYSKIHGKGVAFFGLRQIDLNSLDGHNSYLCFFTDQGSPLFIPYGDFEAVIRQSPLASDGQYKVQIAYGPSTRELYLPRVGHFNVDAFGGLDALPSVGDRDSKSIALTLSHWQAQTLIGGIGALKGYGVFVPPNNVELLDWGLVRPFQVIGSLPAYVEERTRFVSEIDVIWVDHKHDAIAAAFEVEHSTPIYSGLLRFNDVLLTCPGVSRFFVVSNESRRDLFARQIQRPTFQRSGLNELASFLDYCNVVDWHRRLSDAVRSD
jgi:hypothetical protein